MLLRIPKCLRIRNRAMKAQATVLEKRLDQPPEVAYRRFSGKISRYKLEMCKCAAALMRPIYSRHRFLYRAGPEMSADRPGPMVTAKASPLCLPSGVAPVLNPPCHA